MSIYVTRVAIQFRYFLLKEKTEEPTMTEKTKVYMFPSDLYTGVLFAK